MISIPHLGPQAPSASPAERSEGRFTKSRQEHRWWQQVASRSSSGSALAATLAATLARNA